MADDALFVDGSEHALEGKFDRIDRLVNNLVETDVNTFLVSHGFGHHVRTYVEADDDGVGGRCQGDIGLGDIADAGVDDLDNDFLVGELEQALAQCFDGALYVGLEDEVEFLEVSFLHLAEEVVQVHAHSGLFDELFLTLYFVSLGIGFGCLQIVVCQEYFACAGNIRETEDLDGMGRKRDFDASALVVDHGSDLAGACARGDEIADMECTLLYKDVGNRTAALVQLGLEDESSCLSVGVGLEFHDIRCQQDGLEQVLNAGALFGGDFYKLGGAAPCGGNELIFGQFLLDALRVGAFFIDLVDGNDDLNTGRLGMVDRLDGLGHDAVICSDDQDRDICGIGTAHTHGGECLVSGCIEEGDISSVDGDHICTDGLCDAAGFLAGNIGAADGIQQGCFTMVDMAHDADDRRTGNHLGLVLFFLTEQLFDDVDFLLFFAEDVVSECDFFRFFVRNFTVGRHHLALQEEFLDDLGSLKVHALRQIADGNLLGNRDCLDLLLSGNCFLLFGTDEASGSVLAGLVLIVLVIDLILSGSAVFILIALAAVLVSASGSCALSGTCRSASGICAASGCAAASASGVRSGTSAPGIGTGTSAPGIGTGTSASGITGILACTGCAAASASGIGSGTSASGITGILACTGCAAASAAVICAAASGTAVRTLT